MLYSPDAGGEFESSFMVKMCKIVNSLMLICMVYIFSYNYIIIVIVCIKLGVHEPFAFIWKSTMV